MQHASQLFAWHATRAHVDGSGVAFCGSIRAFAALLPAGLVLNGNACMWPDKQSRFNCFHGCFLAWACALHKCETKWAGFTTCSILSDKTSKNWVAVDLVEIKNLSWHYDTSIGSKGSPIPTTWPLPTSFTSLLSTFFWVISPSCIAAGYPGFCAGDRPVAHFYLWCPGHLSEAHPRHNLCLSAVKQYDSTITTHPQHCHCRHFKRTWKNCCRPSLTCGALVLLKTAFPWCWSGSNEGRETKQWILQRAASTRSV